MRIGLTQRTVTINGFDYDATSREWYTFLKGHVVTPIPSILNQDLVALAEDLDMLIITGGDADTARIDVETQLTVIMLEMEKPVLGICHGAFLLTRMFGGEVKECPLHHNVHHYITVDSTRHLVNSYHSLCINQVPLGAEVIARDDQGGIESWQINNMFAVVWHPERMPVPVLPFAVQKLLNGKS